MGVQLENQFSVDIEDTLPFKNYTVSEAYKLSPFCPHGKPAMPEGSNWSFKNALKIALGERKGKAF